MVVVVAAAAAALWPISQFPTTRLFWLQHFSEQIDSPDQVVQRTWLAATEEEGGGRKFNTTSLSLDDIRQVVAYLVNFAEDHALVLPGRVPGYKRTDLKLLPSSETKAGLKIPAGPLARG